VLVLQYSPALAAGVAIMPNTRADNTAADAVSVFEVGFISCPLGKFEVLLLAARLLNREFSKSKPAFTIQKMHSLHRDMRDLNYAGEPVPAMRNSHRPNEAGPNQLPSVGQRILVDGERAAGLSGRVTVIIRGAKPADLPVE
jgi:hypothetical protein